MKIGSGEIATGKDAKGVAGMTGKKKVGAKGTIPADPELDTLDQYERYQRLAFEAAYWDKPTPVLRERLAEQVAAQRGLDDGVRRRRLAAEVWAIDRILVRRRVPS